MELDSNGKRFTIAELEEYRLDLEYSTNVAIVHLPVVHKWNKSVYADLKERIKDLHTFVTTAGYLDLWAGIDKNNEKTNKLAKRVGFEYRGTEDGINVYQYMGVK